jgi:hypothetical protein
MVHMVLMRHSIMVPIFLPRVPQACLVDLKQSIKHHCYFFLQVASCSAAQKGRVAHPRLGLKLCESCTPHAYEPCCQFCHGTEGKQRPGSSFNVPNGSHVMQLQLARQAGLQLEVAET